MSLRWRSAIRVLFAICFLLSALPLASPAAAADDATPPGALESTSPRDGDQAPPVETPPAEESTTPEPTSELATEEPLPTSVPALPAATSGKNQVSTSDLGPETVDLVDLFVQKYWCEDDARAGTTEFTLDSPSDFSSSAVSTCDAQAPTDNYPVIYVTLINVDTMEDFTRELDTSVTTSFFFTNIPIGTYVISESVDGQVTTSDSFEVTLGDTKRVRIINYINETEHPGPSPEGQGDVGGYFLTCTSPDRDGDVEFLISNMANLASVSTCQIAEVAGTLMLYGAHGPNGPIEPGSGVPFDQEAFGFGLSDIANGYYAVSFQAAGSSTPVFSDIFVVSNSSVFIEINVFSEIVPSTDLTVWKDICVDPTLAGQTRFFINANPNEVAPVSASASTECRYARESDGPFTITLTNVDTEETQSGIILGSGSVNFEGLVTGTYTLTEEHDGQFATSDPFTIDPSQSYYTFIRNYIAAQDWTPPNDNEGDEAAVYISGYVCVDPTRNGGAEFFHYTNGSDEGIGLLSAAGAGQTASTAQCREATEADDFQFVMSPVAQAADVSAAADSISFTYVGGGSYRTDDTIHTGQWVLTELTTGTSTATLDIFSYYHYVDFVVYQPAEPTATPTDPVSPTPTATATTPAQPTPTVTATATTTPARPTATATATETAKVTSLPKTGQGMASGSGSLPFLLLAGLSLAILGSGIWIRRTHHTRQ